MCILVHFGTLIPLDSSVLAEGCAYIVVLVELRYWDYQNSSFIIVHTNLSIKL